MREWVTGAAVVWVFVMVGLSCSDSKAQVSVFTNPDADSVTFETYKAKTTVEPKTPAVQITVPHTYGSSSFYVSPGGYATRTYEVESDD